MNQKRKSAINEANITIRMIESMIKVQKERIKGDRTVLKEYETSLGLWKRKRMELKAHKFRGT